MKIVEYSNEMRPRWDAYVMQHEQATLFHLIVWQRIIARSFGYKPLYLAAVEGDKIRGVLPLFMVSNPLTGRTLISTPFAVYGGVCSSDQAAHDALIAEATRLAHEEKVEYLELRLRESDPSTDFQVKELYVSFDTAIDPDPERLVKALPRDTRYMIRKGQKAGLRATRGNNQVDIFYEIYAQSVRNLGTPVFAKKFFRIILQELGDAAEISVIWKGETAVASVLSFRFRDWILPYYGGSTLDGRTCAANNFMYWELLESARQRGIRNFDFGRSKLGTGSYSFKSDWNMRQRPLPYQFCLVKRREMPNFSPANPRFKRVTELWKRIPFPLTKVIGPALVKLFP
jgi:FemAB-related protein (PEP-CTERM system-associated)